MPCGSKFLHMSSFSVFIFTCAIAENWFLLTVVLNSLLVLCDKF